MLSKNCLELVDIQQKTSFGPLQATGWLWYLMVLMQLEWIKLMDVMMVNDVGFDCIMVV